MIVVDANVVAYFAIEGGLSDTARTLTEVDPVWVVPTLCRSELANVLTTSVRVGERSSADAAVLWNIMSSRFHGREFEVHIPSVIWLAEECQITGYDAHYAVLSRWLGIPLVTEDRKLRQRNDNAYSMQEYVQLVGGSADA